MNGPSDREPPVPAAAADLFSPAAVHDPYPVYHALRSEAPLFRLPDTQIWVATRYDDCQGALRSKSFGHRMRDRLATGDAAAVDQPAYANLLNMMLVNDPPDHTRLRGLVAKAFDRNGVERMRGRIRAIAHDLIDRMGASGSGDLVRAFTHPLPVIVICDMLGIPEADRSRFTDETTVRGRLIDPTPMTPEELAETNAAVLDGRAYFNTLFEARRREPQDDLLTALVESETEHGRLTREELSANVGLLFAAGHETTVNLMGNALIALARSPDQWEALRACRNDPDAMAGAVEEFLRFDSPVQLTMRTALDPVTVAGVEIPENSSILCLIGAANRDPDQFADPDRLDIARPNVRPMSFGGGIHFCLGAQLARIEAAEALAILIDRLPNLRLQDADHPDWKHTITLRGPRTLSAVW